MKNWPIRSFCANKLISNANNKKHNTEKKFYTKKTVKLDRIKAQKQNSSIETTDGLYKPKKIKIEEKYFNFRYIDNDPRVLTSKFNSICFLLAK